MPSENSGRPGTNAAAAARSAAERAETEREARRLEAARVAAAKAAAARAEASRLAAMYAQAGPNFIGTGAPPTPPAYVGHYGQQRPTGGGDGNGSGSGSTGGGSTGSGSPVAIPEMPPTPEPVAPITPAPVRTPTRNVTNISDLVPQFNPKHIEKILFENVSAIELSIVGRHDTIEGINQRYSIISNLSEIRKKYDAAKQLSVMNKSKPLTSIYAINIQDKIPQEDYIKDEGLESTYQYLDENNQPVTRQKGYYYIDTNGDLVIELINLERSQEVEVYIDTNGTIYKIDKVEL